MSLTAAVRITAAQSAGLTYTIIDLGTFRGGRVSLAYGLNSSGWVVGAGDGATGAMHAFLYANDQMQDLGTLPGGSISVATSVDEIGRVTGYAHTAAGDPHAFYWPKSGALLDLGTLDGKQSFATTIQLADRAGSLPGAIGGFAEAADGVTHAFLYPGGALQPLALPGGSYSAIAGINASGQVVGEMEIAGGISRAFLFAGGMAHDLGALGGQASVAAAINAPGQVAGTAQTAQGAAHAFLYSNGTMQDLGTLGGSNSAALAINAFAQVVGTSQDAGGVKEAFLAQGAPGGAMMNLNSLLPAGSGWELTVATGINDRGQIVGYGTHDQRLRAFMMTPQRV
jgi:probable HAF family extracellular repeat protein